MLIVSCMILTHKKRCLPLVGQNEDNGKLEPFDTITIHIAEKYRELFDADVFFAAMNL